MAKILKAFDNFCNPKKNIVYERYKFSQRIQQIGDNFDKFLADIQKLIITFEYETQESFILRDRIVLGIVDSGLQEKLLRVNDLIVKKRWNCVEGRKWRNHKHVKCKVSTSRVMWMQYKIRVNPDHRAVIIIGKYRDMITMSKMINVHIVIKIKLAVLGVVQLMKYGNVQHMGNHA